MTRPANSLTLLYQVGQTINANDDIDAEYFALLDAEALVAA